MRPWRRRHLGTDADRATFRTLHTAALASPALRAGLTRDSAERAGPGRRLDDQTVLVAVDRAQPPVDVAEADGVDRPVAGQHPTHVLRLTRGT